jgi:hypothetical protein
MELVAAREVVFDSLSFMMTGSDLHRGWTQKLRLYILHTSLLERMKYGSKSYNDSCSVAVDGLSFVLGVQELYNIINVTCSAQLVLILSIDRTQCLFPPLIFRGW